MPTTYTEKPLNENEISSYVFTQISDISTIFFLSEQIIFYDTCSFIKHSKYQYKERQALFQYFINRKATIFVTKCVLMELIGSNQILLPNYVNFIKDLSNQGIKVIIFNEEDTFSILSKCFSDTEKINHFLSWAIRYLNTPTSTITTTLNNHSTLYNHLIKGLNLSNKDLYKNFFREVRKNKTHRDNLGEELIGLCMYVLANLSGLKPGKLCFLTEDKGTMIMYNKLFIIPNPPLPLANVLLLSTPKLVQTFFREDSSLSRETMIAMISTGNLNGISVACTTPYDLKVGSRNFPSAEDLVKKIRNANEININF